MYSEINDILFLICWSWFQSLWFFQKCRTGGGGGGTPAKDALGNDVVAAEWLKTHGPGDRTLTQGLKVKKINLVL